MNKGVLIFLDFKSDSHGVFHGVLGGHIGGSMKDLMIRCILNINAIYSVLLLNFKGVLTLYLLWVISLGSLKTPKGASGPMHPWTNP